MKMATMKVIKSRLGECVGECRVRSQRSWCARRHGSLVSWLMAGQNSPLMVPGSHSTLCLPRLPGWYSWGLSYYHQICYSMLGAEKKCTSACNLVQCMCRGLWLITPIIFPRYECSGAGECATWWSPGRNKVHPGAAIKDGVLSALSPS